MGPKSDYPPLVVVVGETASGKSSLALMLAQRFDGEIIAADSRTVYKDMDIGTAKPLPEERASVPHHLLDITTPDVPITAAQFKRMAKEVIEEIQSRDRLPILVGGTGLYVNAVIYDYVFAPKADQKQRASFENMSVEELQRYLSARHIPIPVNSSNKRHLIRYAETGGTPKQSHVLPSGALVLGLSRDREEMRRRISVRTDRMLNAGLEHEVRFLVEKYGWDIQAMQTIGYQEFQPYFNKEISYEELKDRIIRNTLQYAKRQRTWFKRNKDIHWICNVEEAIDLVTTLLNK